MNGDRCIKLVIILLNRHFGQNILLKGYKMKIVTQKNIADVKEVELTELDCKEAIANWLRTEHGMQVGRKDIDFLADYDQDWNETKLTGAKITSYNFSPHL